MTISELKSAVRNNDVSRINSVCRVLSVRHNADVIFNVSVLTQPPAAIRAEVSRVEKLIEAM